MGLGLGIAALLLAAPIAAQQGGSCRAEVEKICPEAKPGTPAFRDCVQQNKGKLSAECQQRAQGAQDRIDSMRAACESDIAEHCADAETGSGQVVRCLRSHRKDLTDECRKNLRGARTKRGPGPAPGKAQAKPSESENEAAGQAAGEAAGEPEAAPE